MNRIVVGVDHSEGSRNALEWAVAEARARGARLEAVHVWHYPLAATGPFTAPPAPAVDLFASDAQLVLDESVAAVDASDLPEPIEKVLACGGTARELLNVAKGADLLVIGSRGRGGFAGLLLGSVSQAVSNHAPCPIVIVPPTEG